MEKMKLLTNNFCRYLINAILGQDVDEIVSVTREIPEYLEKEAVEIKIVWKKDEMNYEHCFLEQDVCDVIEFYKLVLLEEKVKNINFISETLKYKIDNKVDEIIKEGIRKNGK